MSKKTVKVLTKEGLDALLNLIAEESVVRAKSDLRNGTYASEEEILQRAAGDEKKAQSALSKDLERLGSSWGTEHRPQQAHEEADEDIFKAIAKGAGGKKKKGGDEDAEAKPDKAAKKEPVEEPEGDEEEAEDDSGRVGGEEAVTFTMIRDELNTIRSGRSLRDKDIRAELKDYVTGLDGDERTALHAFLKGIGQILTAGIESEKADDPSEAPHDIEMRKVDGKQVIDQSAKKTKKGVVRKPVNRAKQRGLEDTSAPIQVGQRQKTEGIRRRIRELMG